MMSLSGHRVKAEILVLGCCVEEISKALILMHTHVHNDIMINYGAYLSDTLGRESVWRVSSTPNLIH